MIISVVNLFRRIFILNCRFSIKTIYAFYVLIFCAMPLVVSISSSSAGDTKTLPGEECTVDPLSNWSDQEKLVWKNICEGKDFNFNQLPGYGGKLKPSDAQDWPAQRVLSEEFLETILLHEPYKNIVSHRGVRIIGAWFKEEIDFSNATIEHDLWLEHCKFSAPIIFFHTRLSQSLSFDYSYFDAPVNLAASQIAGALSLAGTEFNKTFDLTEGNVNSTVLIAEGASFQDGVSLSNARFGSELYIVNTQFAGPVNMISMEVVGDVILEKNNFAKRVDISLSGFGKRFYLINSKFNDDLDLRSTSTKFGFYIFDVEAKKDVVLSSSTIGEELHLETMTVSQNLNLQGVVVDGEFVLYGSTLGAMVFSSNLNVGKQVKIEKNKFNNDISMQKIKTSDNVFFHNNSFNSKLYFNLGDVGGQVEFINNRTKGLFNLDSTKIKTNLLIRKSHFENEISLGQTVLGGQLDIESSEFLGKAKAEGIILNNLFISSSKFFEEVYLRHNIMRRSFIIKETTFHKLVYLGSSETEKASDISNTVFLGPISLSSSDLRGRLTLVNDTFHDEFLFTDAKIKNGLYISSSSFQKDVDLDRTEIQGTLAISENSKFLSRLDFEDVVISNNLFLSGNSILEKELNATGIKCDGGLELSDSQFRGTVNLEYSEVGGSLVLGWNSIFEDEVSLNQAKVQRQISMKKAVFKKTLDMEGVNAGMVFLGDGAVFEGDVYLAASVIDVEVSASKSNFKGILSLTGIRIGQNLVLGDEATFEKPINVNGSQIAGGVIIPSSTIYFIDFSEANIGGLLNLGTNGNDDPKWNEDDGVDLGNARVGAIQVPMDWDKGINLDGFRYNQLGGDVLVETPMLSRDANWYIEFLALQNNYSPQPYKFLAEKLRENGQTEKAEKVLYAGRNRERENSGVIRWSWLTIQKYVIGYGIGNYIFYVCYWIFIFVLLGTVVIYMSEEGKKGERGITWAIFYSVDKLLPIIKLNKEHEDLMPTGLAKYYFYVHIFAGYVLALFLVAGISGLTSS